MSEKSQQNSSDGADSKGKDPKTEQSGSSDKPKLEDLLDSFGKKSASEEPDKGKKTEPSAAEQLAAMQAEIDSLKSANAQAQEDADFAKMTSEVKGDLAVPDYIVDGWLRQQAKDDPRIIDVFEKRAENPKAFKDVVGRLNESFSEETAAQQPKDTTGAKVRGSRETSAPNTAGYDDVKWSELGQQDFESNKAALFKSMRAH